MQARTNYGGKQVINVVIRPQIEKFLPTGMKIIYTDGSGSITIPFTGPGAHNLITWSAGFQGGNATDRTQKTFELKRVKTEMQWDISDYDYLVEEIGIKLNAFQGDITATELAKIELEIIRLGVAEGIFNLVWLGDKDKLTYEGDGATTKYPNKLLYNKNAADIRFNSFDGIWKSINLTASTTPTINQVKKINIVSGAAAQVQTLTFAGTSGTANVNIRGANYLATFNTTLAQTAINFVTTHATNLAKVGITVSPVGNTIVITDTYKGLGFDVTTITNVIANLTGAVVATTANVKASALTTDEAKGLFNTILKSQPTVLKGVVNSKKVLYVTDTVYDNYYETMGSTGIGMATSESARFAMVNGIPTLTYNGIPLVKMGIDAAIETYFGGYAPHRVILTTVENLALILSSANGYSQSKMWFNPDENTTRSRTQLELGAGYYLPELMVVAYQG